MMFDQQLYTSRIFKRLAKALIRLHVCAGWSEALLVAHTTLLEISCHGSIILFDCDSKIYCCLFSVHNSYNVYINNTRFGINLIVLAPAVYICITGLDIQKFSA